LNEPDAIFRGATVRFSTTFYDAAGAVTQPTGAAINIVFVAVGNSQVETDAVEMTPPSGSETQWTAQWDSRNAAPGRVWWSIHTEGGSLPYSVQDGSFDLTANNANLANF
jgi:hypothetical protein